MSSTVIEELIVKLGLNAKDFKKVQKEVIKDFKQTRSESDRTAKELEKDGQKAEEFYKKLRNGALKFFSVLTIGKGLVNFTKDVINSGAQLDRMSKYLGISTDRLSRWTAAIKINGGTADGFIGTMQNLSSALTELKLTGNTGILPYLQALGVSVADATGKARPLEDIIMDMGDKLRALPNLSDAFNIGHNLGLDDATINLLMKGRTEVEGLLKAQKGYTDADAKAARQAAENWESATIRMERLSQTLVIKLVPAFEKLVDLAVKFVEIVVPPLERTIDTTGKVLNATSGLNTMGGGNPKAKSTESHGVMDFFRNLSTGGASSSQAWPVGSDVASKFSAAEKSNGLPPGTLAAIMKQEVGSRQDFIDDPSKYHYEMDRMGRRKSSAFGWFGITDTTGKEPGYGVSPLKDKSVDEQIRFASQYAAARIKAAGGDVRKGLASYGEGNGYADSVMANMRQSGLASSRSGSSKNISIGEIKVYTQATDATGIARDINGALVRQADAGMR